MNAADWHDTVVASFTVAVFGQKQVNLIVSMSTHEPPIAFYGRVLLNNLWFMGKVICCNAREALSMHYLFLFHVQKLSI